MDPTQFAAEPFTEKNPQAADSVEPQSGPAGPYAGPGPFPGYGAFPSYGPSPHHAPFPGYGAVSGPMCAQHAVYHAAMGSPWGPPHYMHPGMPMHGAYPHFTPAQDHGTPFAAPPDRQSGAWQNGHRSAPQTEEQRSAPPGGQTCEQGNPFPGGNPFTYNGQDPLAFAAQCCGMNPKDMGRYGQLMDLCNDFLQGKSDPSKIMTFFATSGTHFWKGALVGAALALILTNSAVKSSLCESLAGIFGGEKSSAS